jgi:hypothetical protein
MRRFLVPTGLVLLLAGCGYGVQQNYNPNAPSPLYGERGCPGSAFSAAGGEPTPYDCIPGGREGGDHGGGGRINR